MFESVVGTILDTTVNSFDFTFCVTVNILTYLVIKMLGDVKSKFLSVWKKRGVLVLVSLLVAIVYYFTGSEVKVLFNSVILAPVSWSWIFKPLCSKFKIDYSAKPDSPKEV